MNGPAARGFELTCFAARWGNSDPIDRFCARVKAAGYDGIDLGFPVDRDARAALMAAVASHELRLGLMVRSDLSDHEAHLAQFRARLAEALAAEVRPAFINCQSGRDYFTSDQNRMFFDLTHEASARSGIPIYHETHRARALFAPAIARRYLERDPRLHLTFDVSHWCVVSESLLADQVEALDLAVARSEHIHARVGHAQGPQVSDPRAPEWAEALAAHLVWWDAIAARKRATGEPLTLLSEFGPEPYMPTEPFSGRPLANQWDVNLWTKNFLRARYC